MPVRENLLRELIALQFNTEYDHFLVHVVPVGYGSDFSPEDFWEAHQKNDDLLVDLVEMLDFKAILKSARHRWVNKIEAATHRQVVAEELALAAMTLVQTHDAFKTWQGERSEFEIHGAFSSYRIPISANARHYALDSEAFKPFEFSAEDLKEAILTTCTGDPDWRVHPTSPRRRNAPVDAVRRFGFFELSSIPSQPSRAEHRAALDELWSTP